MDGYLVVMTEDAPDPTGERMRDPEGVDTPNRPVPPDDDNETEEPEPLPG
jgi:hypothetical protein